MGRFWNAATDQAGREFGARHYRWFAGARIARGVAPALLTVLGAVGVVVALIAGYRWLSPDWSAVGTRIGNWGSVAGVGALWIIGGIAAAAAMIVLLRYVVRNWWRVSLFRPMRLRRPMWWFRRF
ncbi:hypothetical protein [Paractinoplanes globisporus]|uniref:Uncharacterized protein n=1 Tax=Paractinoplanes globisporus TaxID=113565 RepID=A0ABW6WK85_9ACTN|nr:hypothetical protein [Actinoplanes globisporus]